jgi:hypothetical protein
MATATNSMIVLNTYKKKDENGIGIEGESQPLYFNKAWVIGKIAPQTLDDFMNDYTYDDTEWLIEEAKKTENIIFKK